eukprot:9474165-Pyramimonas_sp.AAC.2
MMRYTDISTIAYYWLLLGGAETSCGTYGRVSSFDGSEHNCEERSEAISTTPRVRPHLEGRWLTGVEGGKASRCPSANEQTKYTHTKPYQDKC